MRGNPVGAISMMRGRPAETPEPRLIRWSWRRTSERDPRPVAEDRRS